MKTNNLLTTFFLVAVLSLSQIGCKNNDLNKIGSTEKVVELTAVEAEEFILEWAGVVTATENSEIISQGTYSTSNNSLPEIFNSSAMSVEDLDQELIITLANGPTSNNINESISIPSDGSRISIESVTSHKFASVIS